MPKSFVLCNFNASFLFLKKFNYCHYCSFIYFLKILSESEILVCLSVVLFLFFLNFLQPGLNFFITRFWLVLNFEAAFFLFTRMFAGLKWERI